MIDNMYLFGSEFSSDGEKVFTSSYGRVELWNSRTGNALGKLDNPSDYPIDWDYPIGCFACSNDGKFLIGGGLFGSMAMWDIESGTMLHFIYPPLSYQNTDHPPSVNAVAFNANGNEMATLRGGTLIFWDTKTGEMIRKGKGEYINGLVYGFGEMYLYSDGARVFTRLLSYSQITNFITGERVADYGYSNAALSMDGRKAFLFDSPSQAYQIVDVANKAVMRTFSPNVIGYKHTIAHDNQTVAYFRDQTIYIERWPLVGDWKELAQITIETPTEHNFPNLRFSPNGKQLMVRQSKSLKLYDVSDLTSGVSEAETPKQ